MQSRHYFVLSLVGLLVACQSGPVTPPRVAASATPKAAPAASPSPSAAAAIVPAKLVQPTGTSVLKGVVQVDASYIVASGGGNIVASGGGNIVASGGGNVISGNASSIIGGNASSVIGGNASSIIGGNASSIIGGNASAVVASGGDPVVAQGGGNILVGGQIVASGAGNIVASGAGNIVASGGGNIVASGGGNYRLKQADALAVQTTRPPYGATLPTVGTLISARSMVTGQPVPIGEDGHGQKVYTVYSNLAGEFQLFLPANLDGLVTIEARVPKREDQRSIYQIVSGMGDIDEDSAEVAKYLRRSFGNKFRNILDLLGETRGSANDPFLHPDKLLDFFRGNDGSCNVTQGEIALETVVAPPLQELLQAIKDNPKIKPADYPVLAQRLGDVVIGNAKNLTDYRILPSTYNAFGGPLAKESNPYPSKGADAKVLQTMSEILGTFRANVTALGLKLGDKAAVSAYFAKKPYLAYANKYYQKLHPNEPAPHYTIERPSDLADFLVDEYFPLISNNRYGCLTGECPSPVPTTNPCDTSASPIPTPAFSVAPCSVFDGCLPPEGIAAVNNDQIHALSYNVIKDLAGSMTELGVKADKPLRPSDVHVIYAASSSLGINLLGVVADKRCELLSIIANYPNPGTPCVEPSN